MAAPLSLSAYLYTALTMAAFEDMGFFRANWGMEEPMGWGSNAGCDLLQEKCITNGTTKYPGMFCTEESFKCTSDRTSLGDCSLDEYDTALPEWFQYFSDPKIGAYPHSLTDYCTVVEPIFRSCANTEEQPMTGNVVSSDSWCLDGNELTVNTPLGASQTGGVCAAVSCADGAVKVRYAGDANWHDCPEGRSLTPSETSLTFASGSIKCPKYTEVCTIAANGSSRITIKANADSTVASYTVMPLVWLSLVASMVAAL
ncbi:putative surface protease GP63, putative,metallopeptidase [Trypanosoma grayi]|uniref:putative surface protease GP63, putative,metallopeptidase n=1 Tax=Trypanosoma grayi TaxID=71804 RepID=UPI0004F43112|nr:putative surface protease GP63, putative,metallopeptidase [Trypanosoma grayi]KEG06314.1 putative surface protease GP63, putative,metallopeptidase [Trypanosoma grayi]